MKAKEMYLKLKDERTNQRQRLKVECIDIPPAKDRYDRHDEDRGALKISQVSLEDLRKNDTGHKAYNQRHILLYQGQERKPLLINERHQTLVMEFPIMGI